MREKEITEIHTIEWGNGNSNGNGDGGGVSSHKIKAKYKVRNSVEKETEKNVSNYMVSLFRRAYIKSYRDIIIQMNEPNRTERLVLASISAVLYYQRTWRVICAKRKARWSPEVFSARTDFAAETNLLCSRVQCAANQAWLANGNELRRWAWRVFCVFFSSSTSSSPSLFAHVFGFFFVDICEWIHVFNAFRS